MAIGAVVPSIDPARARGSWTCMTPARNLSSGRVLGKQDVYVLDESQAIENKSQERVTDSGSTCRYPQKPGGEQPDRDLASVARCWAEASNRSSPNARYGRSEGRRRRREGRLPRAGCRRIRRLPATSGALAILAPAPIAASAIAADTLADVARADGFGAPRRERSVRDTMTSTSSLARPVTESVRPALTLVLREEIDLLELVRSADRRASPTSTTSSPPGRARPRDRDRVHRPLSGRTAELKSRLILSVGERGFGIGPRCCR